MLSSFQKIRHSIWLTYHGLNVDEVLHHYQDFQERQQKSVQENLDYQWQRLQQLLHHAYDHVPYYRNLFEEHGLTPESIKTPEDYQRIPVLTKDIIQKQRENLLAQNYRGTPMIRAASGGSTGQPVRLWKTPMNKAVEMASTWGFHEWIGWKVGDRAMRLWGSLDPLTLKRKLYRLGSQVCIGEIRRNVHRMEAHVMREIEDCLKNFRPKILIGYTNAIHAFAQYLLDEKRTCPGLLGIVPTAEMLFPHQRQAMEQAFECRVYNRYASQEINQYAGECEHGNLHLNILHVYFEFVGKGGSVEKGEPGSVVVTDLTNYAMPFIRYQVGDIAVPDSKACPCGRSLPLVRDIKGRLSDVIVTPDRGYIFADDIVEVFYPMSEVKQFQVIQQNLRALTVKIVKNDGVGPEIDDFVKNQIQKAVGSDMEVSLEVVEDIPRLSSGKHRICISQVSQDGNLGNIQ